MGVGWLIALVQSTASSYPQTAPLERLGEPENDRTGDRRTLLGQGITLGNGSVRKEKYKIKLHSGTLQDKHVIKYFAILELVLSYFVHVSA